MTSIENIIKEKGLILSGEIIKILIEKDKITNQTARKRLSRAKGDFYKIKGLFKDNQILFHEKDIYGTEEYYSGIVEALKNAGKQYYIIIQSLAFHYGQMKLSHLPSYSINPVKLIKGHLHFNNLLKKLVDLKIVWIENDYINLSDSFSDGILNTKKSHGIEVAKHFLLVQFNDWTRKIGLVSYNTSKFNSEFGKYQFTFVSPSYIGTLPKKKLKSVVPGFVVADILIGNTIVKEQIEFFVNKIRVLKAQKKIADFIPFLIVDSIDTNSLNKLKSEGIVVGFMNELFGKKYKDLLNSLINLVTNAGAILKKNPEAYLDLILKLNKLVDGKTNNLRGDLFELAVGYYQGRVCKSIEIGMIINHLGTQREIDVYGTTEAKIYISECKGYNQKVSHEDIDSWLGKKIPIIRNWILAQPSISHKDIVFEFWSTGGFTDDALILLEKRKKSTRKYKIEYYDLGNMISKSKEIKSKKFTEILREYYVKEI